MTAKEAIEAIENDLKWHDKELKPRYKEALRMAIQALESSDRDCDSIRRRTID